MFASRASERRDGDFILLEGSTMRRFLGGDAAAGEIYVEVNTFSD